MDRRSRPPTWSGAGVPRLHLLVMCSPVWQAPAERLANHSLGFSVAVAWRQVQQIDSRRQGGMNGSHTLVESCWPPEHAEASTTEGQGQHREQRPYARDSI